MFAAAFWWNGGVAIASGVKAAGAGWLPLCNQPIGNKALGYSL
jgi:hypothetical protein